MTPERRADFEARLRCHRDRGSNDALTMLLEGYGTELRQFLLMRLRERESADEVFAQVAEDLWKGLPGFRGESSFRVWAYTVARNAASRYVENARRRRNRETPLSDVGSSLVAPDARTRTQTLARTETQSRLAELRLRLPVNDQTLLLLRVNRGFDWKEIARVLLPDDCQASEGSLIRESARLRKRFQLVKERLRRMALDEGLLSAR